MPREQCHCYGEGQGAVPPPKRRLVPPTEVGAAQVIKVAPQAHAQLL